MLVERGQYRTASVPVVVESTRHGLSLSLAYYVHEYLAVDRMKLTEANHKQLFGMF